jgi:hypothetical protein
MTTKNFCIGLKPYNDNDYIEDHNDKENKIYIKKTGEVIERDIVNECPNIGIYPSIIPHKERVIAIGDIHGDMELAINFLKISRVIEEVDMHKILKRVDEVIIEEHLKKLTINHNSTLNFNDEINQKNTYNEISNHVKNQVEVVYRYYKIGDEFYVKIIQEDNNPYHSTRPIHYVCKTTDYDRFCDNSRWFKWIGATTHVVQVGDQIDRCRPWHDGGCKKKETTINDEDSDLEIMLFYDSLDRIAQEKGGRLFSLLGNHEIMNVRGDMRYVSYKGLLNYNNIKYNDEYRRLKNGKHIRISKFKETISKKMSCTRSTILIIGDYLFVHGGIAMNLATDLKIIEVNSLIRKFLYGSLIGSGDLQRLLESSKFSPLWYRKLAYIPEDDIDGKQNNQCKTLYEPTVNKFNKNNEPTIESEPTINIKGMIIGHTPQFTVFGKGITTACANRIIRVDIGASTAFDSVTDSKTKQTARVPQVIEIITNLGTKESTIKILK